MQDRYTFPAFFCYEKGVDGVGVVFPDLPGCVTHGANDEDALRAGRDVLIFHLWGMEEDGDSIPEPTRLDDIDCSEYQEPDVKLVTVLLDVFMPPFRERMNNKATTRAVTVPRWLDLEAKAANLNYSQILQDGIMERLGINRTARRTNKEKATA